MCHRFALEAINRSLQDEDLMDNNMLFGGKTVLLSGDFRQILPVIPRGSIGQIIDSCINKSQLWQFFTVLKLTKNMRVQHDCPTIHFPSFLLKIGEGLHSRHKLFEPDYFEMPPQFLLPTTKDPKSNIKGLIDFVYDDLTTNYKSNNYFSERVILAPLCAVVQTINNQTTLCQKSL